MKIYKPYFKEEIVGLNAIVYHRTRPNSVGEIVKKGFKPGYGQMYGKGLYTTYSLDSQLENNMDGNYGPVILKFKVSLHDCLILDYEQAKKIYGEKYKLMDQLEELGIIASFKKQNVDIAKLDIDAHPLVYVNERPVYIADNSDLDDIIIADYNMSSGTTSNGQHVNASFFKNAYYIADKKSDYRFMLSKQMANFDDMIKKTDYTSEVALEVLKIEQIRTKIKGIVFTGAHDGNVCVIYNTDIAIPMSYCITQDENKVWMEAPKTPTYTVQNAEQGQRLKAQKFFVSPKDPEAWTKVDSSIQLKRAMNK